MVSLSADERQVLDYLLVMEPASREEVGNDFSILGEGKVPRILERLVALGFVVGDQLLKVTVTGAGYVFDKETDAEAENEEAQWETVGDRKAVEESLETMPTP